MILTIRNEFRKVHEDSHYIHPTRKGPIGTTLIFDVRYNLSNSSLSKVMPIDVSIFNTGSPKQSIQLIKDIERHFMDRIIIADGYMIKFDQYTPITTRNRIDNMDDIEHIELTMETKLYKNNTDGPDNIQISRV